MSLEQFLSYRPPSYKKILHPPSVDLEWNIRDAHDLMNHVCHIVLAVEKNPRYTELCDFLKKRKSILHYTKNWVNSWINTNLKSTLNDMHF